MNYGQVVERLEAIDTHLERTLPREDAEHPSAAYFKAKRDYERAWAEAYLCTSGTVEERKNLTIVELYKSEAYKALVTAEAAYEAWRAVDRTLSTRASIGQSLLKAFQQERQ